MEVSEALRFHKAVQESATWTDRMHAFYLMISLDGAQGGTRPWESLRGILAAQPDGGDQLRLDLIHALEEESTWMKSQPALTEKFTGYEGDLLAAVASLRDQRSIPALLDVIDTGGIAISALADLGEPSILPATAKLASKPCATLS